MPTITFSVEGQLPPKKTRNSSVWGDKQRKQLKALREAAILARKEAFRQANPSGDDEPSHLEGKISLTLHVQTRPEPTRNRGDLDNFVSGVCDGLGKVHPSVSEDNRNQVKPAGAIAFVDDRSVFKIEATRCDGPEARYDVIVTGEKWASEQ